MKGSSTHSVSFCWWTLWKDHGSIETINVHPHSKTCVHNGTNLLITPPLRTCVASAAHILNHHRRSSMVLFVAFMGERRTPVLVVLLYPEGTLDSAV